MRLIGGSMIIAGCIGMGVWYRTQMVERINALREMVRILELLMGEVRYGKSTLPECCKRLSMHLPNPYGRAMEEIYGEMKKKEGTSFSLLFKERLEKAFAGLPLSKEDKTKFFRFLEQGSCEDGKMQVRSMEQSKECLEETISTLAGECVEKGRVAVSLGALSGILLVIVLL